MEAFDTNYKRVCDFNQNPTEFIDTLKDKPNTKCGKAAANIEFGLTANSEYELLTNLNTAEGLSFNTLVFELAMENPMKSNADFFNSKGYNSIYMHPFYAAGYSRYKRVPQLGFNKYFFIEDMEDEKWDYSLENINTEQSTLSSPVYKNFDGDTLNAEKFNGIESYRGFPSDKQNFKRVMEAVKASEAPVYLFNMTVQNHGEWSKERDIEKGVKDFPIVCTNNDINEAFVNEITSYANSIHMTDLALKEFYESVINFDEPTVVVCVGDHSAGLVKLLEYKKYSDFYNNNPLEAREVPYYIFANFDIPTTQPDEVFSTSFLTVKLLDLIRFDYKGDKTLELVKKISEQVSIITYDLDYLTPTGLPIERSDIKDIDIYKGLQYFRLYDCDYKRRK